MSAICGVVGLDGRTFSPADLAGMLEVLAPLGPDGGGTWAGASGRCGVAIGARLRHATPEDIVDRQPVHNRDGSLAMVGDGRIDNRAEIAGLLALTNDTSIPDSEFFLAAYERWGEAMLDRIVGEFALAIVDRRRGGVLLARDHVGARPLCFHERKGLVAFASSALSLTGFEGVGHRLDITHAAEALAVAHSSERTFVQGVRWVPAATKLWIDPSGVDRSTWWDHDPYDTIDLDPDEHDLRLRRAFDLSVSARLRSLGSVGAGTSGGLDSTSAAASAAMLLTPKPLRTYTAAPPPGWAGAGVGRPGWDADESPIVRALAEMHPNIVPSFVHPDDGSDLLELQEPLWELGAGPARNPCNMLWMFEIRKRAAADGIGTLLHADLGNLAFSADGPEWLVALLRAGHLRTALAESKSWSSATGQSRYRVYRFHVAPLLSPRSMIRLVRRMKGRPEAGEEWVSSTALRPEVADELDLVELLPQLDDRGKPRWRDIVLSVLHHNAGQADVSAAVTAATGVEGRDPTGDRRVLEVAATQPEWVRRRNGETRATARGAMADRLPDVIVNRTQRGEQLPDWLDVMTARREDFAREVEEAAAHGPSLELIDVARLQKLVNDWPDRTYWARPQVITDYRLVLLRALMISRYLRWFEQRGKTPWES